MWLVGHVQMSMDVWYVVPQTQLWHHTAHAGISHATFSDRRRSQGKKDPRRKKVWWRMWLQCMLPKTRAWPAGGMPWLAARLQAAGLPQLKFPQLPGLQVSLLGPVKLLAPASPPLPRVICCAPEGIWHGCSLGTSSNGTRCATPCSQETKCPCLSGRGHGGDKYCNKGTK